MENQFFYLNSHFLCWLISSPYLWGKGQAFGPVTKTIGIHQIYYCVLWMCYVIHKWLFMIINVHEGTDYVNTFLIFNTPGCGFISRHCYYGGNWYQCTKLPWIGTGNAKATKQMFSSHFIPEKPISGQSQSCVWGEYLSYIRNNYACQMGYSICPCCCGEY